MVEQTPARILVVDDEDAIRRTLAVLLERRGYTVAAAANAEEALAWLVQRAFDLVLVDLQLPGMNGLELARIVEGQQPSAKIVVLTGSSDFRGRPIEEQVGHFDYLLKTTSPADVLAHVATILASQPRE